VGLQAPPRPGPLVFDRIPRDYRWMPRRLLLLALLACALFPASASAAPPANNNFASATTLGSSTSVSISGTNVEATTEAGEDQCCWVYNSVWFKWTAPKTGNYRLELCANSFNSHVKVLTGTAVNALEKIDENDDDPGCGAAGNRSRLTFIAGAGQEYKVQIGSQIEDQTGTISGSLALVSPPNDFFADSTQLTGTSAPLGGTNVDATTESGEDPCCWLYNSIWHKWTAPKTGNYRAELCGSAFNTHIKVLTGTTVTALQKIAENDDDPGCGPDGSRSRLTFIAGAGQEYKIQIGSQIENQTGAISGSLALVSPPNDFFADATTLTGSTAAITGKNVDASVEQGEENCCFTAATVWYRWTAPAAGSYRLETCASDFKTYIKVLQGTVVTALQKIAENNGTAAGCGPAGDRAAATFTAGANAVYYFQIGSAADPRGNITGSIAPVSAGGGTALPPAGLPAKSTTASVKKSGKYFLITVKGTLLVPAGVQKTSVCPAKDVMRASVRKGKTVLKSGRASLSKACSYKKTLKVLRSKVGKAKKVTVRVEYPGNKFVRRTVRSFSKKV
jgi:hypothetical protein